MLLTLNSTNKKFKGILDEFPTPQLALGMTKLLSSYKGSICACYDGANQFPLGFTSKGQFDNSTLSSFIPSSNIRALNWNNQNSVFPSLISQVDDSLRAMILRSSPTKGLVFDGVNDNYIATSTYGVVSAITLFQIVDVPLNSKGAFFKIGNTTSGIGVGTGGSSFDEPGNNLIILLETKSWIPTTFNIQGKNLITVRFSGNTLNVWLYKSRQDYTTATVVAPASVTSLGGYSNRCSSASISHTIVYNIALDDYTISAIQDKLLNI